MKASTIKRKLLITGIAIIITCSHAFAETTENSSSSPSEPIMQDMGKNMQTIADGISREDWKLVENTAPLIAEHPQPPLTEKIRILAYVGTDVSKFKSHDGKTHEAARVLEESATRDDGYAVIADFATLQNTCLMCHQRFRKSFQEHFYGNR
jgi:cytochrome c556